MTSGWRDGSDGDDVVRSVLARAREAGLAPSLCDVLADPSSPEPVRERLLALLLATLGEPT